VLVYLENASVGVFLIVFHADKHSY